MKTAKTAKRSKSGARPGTIDEYLAAATAEQRATLQRLRRTIHSLVPHTEECISYTIPAFRYRGQVIAGFATRSNGFSYFPFSGSTLKALGAHIKGYGGTKSALHFDAKGLPNALVKKLLRARIAELDD